MLSNSVIYFIARKFRGVKISWFRGRVQKTAKLKCTKKINNDDDDEIFEPERNFSDVFSNFTYELSFPYIMS